MPLTTLLLRVLQRTVTGRDGDGDDGTAGTVTDNDESAGHSLLAYLRMHRCLFQDNVTHKGMGPSYSGQMAKCMCMKK